MALRFSLLNAQGLISKRTNKLNSPELQHILNTSDVVLFTESWTDENAELSINNFYAVQSLDLKFTGVVQTRCTSGQVRVQNLCKQIED